jgi:peptidoglycan hydrolase-like protein with peptidoglycan-binding domain
MRGLDLLGAIDTIPTAGVVYTDVFTVASVQQALVDKHYDCGNSGPAHDGVDGMFGPKTKAAIKKMQKDVGLQQTGKIDAGVISTLQVTPGVLPPGVTLQDNAALQAQVALDAATKAEHAQSGEDVQAAAQLLVEATPPAPPELKQQAQAALAKAKAASTPAQVKAAADSVKKAAADTHESVKPSWFVEPAWSGGPPRWQAGLYAVGGVVGLTALGYAVKGG